MLFCHKFDLSETTADVCDGTQPYCDIDYFAIHCAALICTCVFTGSATQVSLQVSGDGKRVLLVAITGSVLLWECVDVRDLMGLRDGTVKGRWAHIRPLNDSILPSAREKEASQHTVFVKTEVSILKRRHSWHIGHVLVSWRPALHVLFSVDLISYSVLFLGYGWCLLVSLCFHNWEEANRHLPENSVGRGSCESVVSN